MKLYRKLKRLLLQYVAQVVGPTRTRGVDRVMPVENIGVHSKGLAFYRKERYENDAIHRNG